MSEDTHMSSGRIGRKRDETVEDVRQIVTMKGGQLPLGRHGQDDERIQTTTSARVGSVECGFGGGPHIARTAAHSG